MTRTGAVTDYADNTETEAAEESGSPNPFDPCPSAPSVTDLIRRTGAVTDYADPQRKPEQAEESWFAESLLIRAHPRHP